MYPSILSKEPAAGEPSTSGRGDGQEPRVRFADIGCGFGGLLIRCAHLIGFLAE